MAAVIQTTLGPVAGFVDTHVQSDKSTAGQKAGNEKPVVKYLGVPFGTAGRWEQARAPEPWTETRKCIEYGPSCPQLPGPIGQKMAQSEGFLTRLHLGISEADMFTLNIYATEGVKEGDDVPVLFWIYGGAWRDGSAGAMLYDATNVIRTSPQPIIVVAVNYRVNLFGFMAAQDLVDADGLVGNYGLRDQLLSLRFVKANIRKFGGSVDNITIYGESAGACSVGYHIGGLEPLFKRAIAQSGGASTMGFQDLKDHERSWTALLKAFNITSDNAAERVRQARAIPTKDLLGYLYKNPGLQFTACRESGSKAIWSEHPDNRIARGEFVSSLESFMAGVCTDEGAVFAELFGMFDKQAVVDKFVGAHGPAAGYYKQIYPNIEDISKHTGDTESHPASRMIHDELFEGPVVFEAERLSKSSKGVKCFLYRSNAILPDWHAFGWGVHHASELPFSFNSASLWKNDAQSELGQTALDFVQKWVSFAATGQPADASTWPAYSASDRRRYVFENGGAAKGHLEDADLTPAMSLQEQVIKGKYGIQEEAKSKIVAKVE